MFFRQQTEAQTSQLLVQGHRGRCESSQSVAVLCRTANLWHQVSSAGRLYWDTQAGRFIVLGFCSGALPKCHLLARVLCTSRVPLQLGGDGGVRVGAELCCLLGLLCLPGKGLGAIPGLWLPFLLIETKELPIFTFLFLAEEVEEGPQCITNGQTPADDATANILYCVWDMDIQLSACRAECNIF